MIDRAWRGGVGEMALMKEGLCVTRSALCVWSGHSVFA